jgi:hypothetical protein
VNNAHTAVNAIWNWGKQFLPSLCILIPEHFLPTGWTYQGVNINACQVGFDLVTGGTTSATQVRFKGLSDFLIHNSDRICIL